LPVRKGATIETKHLGGIIEDPSKSAGKALRAAGWAVTREATAGECDAISFAGGVETGTSGTCTYTDGSMDLFKDNAIKAQDGAVKICDGDLLHEQAAVLRVTG
jgi:hypothetical protein